MRQNRKKLFLYSFKRGLFFSRAVRSDPTHPPSYTIEEFVCDKVASFQDLLLMNNYFNKHILMTVFTIYVFFLKKIIIVSKINDTWIID